VYYDPDAIDPLEAEKATLPLDVQRRMVALEAAVVKAWPKRKLPDDVGDPREIAEEISAYVAEAEKWILELASLFEKHLREEERSWELGLMPYNEYLQTPEWQEKRAEARARAGGRCQVCNSLGPLDVHHRTYERRGAERESDLIVLCRNCHELFHRFGRLHG
jgi:hypothetical protein